MIYRELQFARALLLNYDLLLLDSVIAFGVSIQSRLERQTTLTDNRYYSPARRRSAPRLSLAIAVSPSTIMGTPCVFH